MNQILDRKSSKKTKVNNRNPQSTPKIIKVYAALMIVFALCLIGKGSYTFYDNYQKTHLVAVEDNSIPSIELIANEDKVTINVSAGKPIEEVRYQWYTGTRTVDDIHLYNDAVAVQAQSSEMEEADDEDVEIKEEEMLAIGKNNLTKGNGQNTLSIPNIGIPKGTNTLHITVRLQAEGVFTEFVKTYTTDVGVDKIAPTIMKVYVNADANNPRLVVIARDETEIKSLIYSINNEREETITDRTDSKTIKAEIPLKINEVNEVTITAVDKAANTAEPTNKTIDLYKGKPEIVEFTAETDFSKVYARARYDKGIKKTEYTINNGNPVVVEYDNLPKEVIIEIPTVEGSNHIVVRAYAENESVYGEDYGDCDYNP